jgi:hypothetical protein
MEEYWISTTTQANVNFEIPNNIVYHYIKTEK